MSIVGKIWKVVLALILLAAAAFMFYMVYTPEKEAYESKYKNLNTSINVLENTIAENSMYEDIQEALPGAIEELQAKRLELYSSFPVEMKEEDQIMYVLYLEEIFGTKIDFAFATAQYITGLSDGAALEGLTLTVNYQTDYDGFKEMVNYLATDSRITSVQLATINYDTQTDTATGTVTLLLYILNSDNMQYVEPDVQVPDTGKDNPYD